jgi:carboxyl-terminal processing protease
MPRRNLTIIVLAAAVSLFSYDRAMRSRYSGVFGEALRRIRGHYVEQIDERKLFDAAMDGMIRSELDPYSAYINPDAYNQFKVAIDQRFGGVGVEVMMDPDTDRLTIASPLVGTPAYKAGAQAGDTIVAIDGVTTKGLQLENAVGLLRGKPGTDVTMTVLHAGETEPVDLHITRANIDIESVLGDTHRDDGTWNFFLADDERIGYIRLVNFGEETVAEIERVLTSEDHPVEAWILDLRGNPGGLLSAAVDICDMFIDKGTIVSTLGRDKVELEKFTASPDNTIVPKDVPLVILVDEGSASASEIVAACLQDHKRAIVIGERTWGKGTVQSIVDLEGGKSALKITIATYWRPSGKNIHRLEADRTKDENGEWGVRPNDGFEVPMTDDERRAYYIWRRERDVIRVPGRDTSEAEVSADGETASPDLPLNAAIKYLQQKLDGKQPQRAM